ncbi:Pc13g04000 [Penicillium rubens Wisconsin 54-1255]|uniref:Pc13g04000 protein n=1 Tax=Penicillium rubens (strain ATCC 28089 / DSM 1075 / NRRL 1951 / Wisconsin 54-1255) TaxID=500485 RepID=B6H256_PENRW|nr:Pc13g04000 [Penicillium rubens Wisconsin 54-1255]
MVVKENGQVADATPKPNGQTRLEKPRKKGFVRWTVGLVVRLCIWYTLVTTFLRCPSRLTDLTETSPRVCKPYLIARSHVEPYVTPYYDIYAAPYVDQARPYVDQARPYVEVFNQQVYTPASKVAKSGYEKYGAPALKQAQVYGIEQWQRQVAPRLQTAQDKAHKLYLTEIDPYVQQSVAVVSPYYQLVNTAVLNVYQGHLVPLYARSKPFIGIAYSTGQDVLTTHVLPWAQYSWSSAVYFANSSLWPHITGLYSEQVEPQLVKIGQRLASYREGKRLRAVVEDVDSSTVQPVTSSATKSQEQIHTTTTVTSTSTPQASPQPTLTPTEQAQQAREKIDSDLERWQEKFALAADKGIEDLEDRIEEIVSALVASSANSHGRSLHTALQSVSAEQLSSIKQRINELAASMPEEDAPEIEEATSDLLIGEIRTSAISVRDRAHALREWSISFEDELVRRVNAAVNSTLDVLDSIRDLGLQEIGMRWAWMDGVTYKDWAKYHALKAQLEEWRNDIRNVGMNHKSVSDARAVASEILDQGMHEAEQAARELVRLKDVGIWKIAAREVSDDFETRTEAPPARPKPQEQTKESDEEEAKVDSDDDESSEEVAASMSDDAYEETLSTNEPSAAADAEADFDGANESVMDDDIVEEEQPPARPAFGVSAADANSHQAPILDGEGQDVMDSPASKSGDTYAVASNAVSEAIYGASSTPGVGERAASLASDQYSLAWSAASTVINGTPLSSGEKAYSDASEKYSDAVAA